MASKNILSVGFDWPIDDIQYVFFRSTISLLDGDIIVFNPDISSFMEFVPNEYLGKPCLSDSESFTLKEISEHWKKELREALDVGKTIFVFLNSVQEVYIATGEKQYSGTGRSRQTTRIVTNYSNYYAIPLSLDLVNSFGSSMKLVEGSEIISTYWSEFGPKSVYRVKLESSLKKPLILTRTGNKIVGAHVKGKTGGNLFLLPYFSFDTEEYYEKDEKSKTGYVWKSGAVPLGKRLLSIIVGIDKSARADTALTPKPERANDAYYLLPREIKIQEKLLKLESRIEKLQNERQELKSSWQDEGLLRGLLYEKSVPLEHALVKILKLLGFETKTYRDAESEFDVVFESKEGRFIGEAEGKDTKPINIEKMRQLEMNIHEDFAREEVETMAKGVLFGNAHRLTEPSKRPDFFTNKCMGAAKRSGVALVKTPDLFPVAKYLSEKSDKKYAAACRKVILETEGDIVVFPQPPELATESGKEIIQEKVT